ncbi:hypothetical protein CFFPNG_00705 [Methylorubrum aminovorans]
MPFHGINFQYLPKGASRPQDEGETVDISDDPRSAACVPQVGDFVVVQQAVEGGASFQGRVRSRLFYYLHGGVSVNIVVEEVDDTEVDWGKLVKE